VDLHSLGRSLAGVPELKRTYSKRVAEIQHELYKETGIENQRDTDQLPLVNSGSVELKELKWLRANFMMWDEAAQYVKSAQKSGHVIPPPVIARNLRDLRDRFGREHGIGGPHYRNKWRFYDAWQRLGKYIERVEALEFPEWACGVDELYRERLEAARAEPEERIEN
jgi:hypothetical protein